MLDALKADIHHNFKSQMTEKRKKLINLEAHSPGTLVSIHGFAPAHLLGR